MTGEGGHRKGGSLNLMPPPINNAQSLLLIPILEVLRLEVILWLKKTLSSISNQPLLMKGVRMLFLLETLKIQD